MPRSHAQSAVPSLLRILETSPRRIKHILPSARRRAQRRVATPKRRSEKMSQTAASCSRTKPHGRDRGRVDRGSHSEHTFFTRLTHFQKRSYPLGSGGAGGRGDGGDGGEARGARHGSLGESGHDCWRWRFRREVEMGRGALMAGDPLRRSEAGEIPS
ncbi:hypothetical protein Mapa_014101 [Marchantia paleacea]|nr:hypothetical protein Mapa_014101 [Marchantia paleacea]